MAHLQSTTWNQGTSGKKGTGAATNATVTVDLNTGDFFEIDLQDSYADIATFTINNPVPAGSATYIGISFVLKITQGSTARQFTWSSLDSGWGKRRWADQGIEAPALSMTNNAVDILSFVSYDKGATWWGSVIGHDFQ